MMVISTSFTAVVLSKCHASGSVGAPTVFWSWVNAALGRNGVMRAARQYALEQKIDCFCFLISDSLARLLRRTRMEFTTIGALVDSRGSRRPYVQDVHIGYRGI